MILFCNLGVGIMRYILVNVIREDRVGAAYETDACPLALLERYFASHHLRYINELNVSGHGKGKCHIASSRLDKSISYAWQLRQRTETSVEDVRNITPFSGSETSDCEEIDKCNCCTATQS